jgi:hypothetical protein
VPSTHRRRPGRERDGSRRLCFDLPVDSGPGDPGCVKSALNTPGALVSIVADASNVCSTICDMPVIVKSQAIFPFFTGTARDVWSNTMHWLWDEVTGDRGEVADAITTSLDNFYSTVYGNGGADYVNWALARVECFFQFDTPPRVPEVRPMVITTVTSPTNIPTEAACVLSYHAAPVSGVDRRRLHNRIYLGGLNEFAITASTASSFPVISSAFRTNITTATTALLAENGAGVNWVQHSSAGGVEATRTITGGWVDNSPDTQRRRSVNPTARTSWTA